MKPRHITIIIWIVIALLSIVCWFTPKGGFTIGNFTLRWPTLAEVLDPSTNDSTITYTDKTWIAEAEDYNQVEEINEEELAALIAPRQREVQPLQPKYYLFDSIEETIIDTIEDLTEDIADEGDTIPEPVVTTTPEITPEVKHTTPIVSNNNSTTTPVVKKEEPAPKSSTTTSPSQKSTIDLRQNLTAFYNSLDSASMMPIRVVHYGDSQIEEDRISDILREYWQTQYGGGGVGLIPLHQTVPTRSIRQYITINGIKQTAKGGPQRYLIYGPRSKRQEGNDYGMMGQVAIMDSTIVAGSQQIKMHIEPVSKKHKTYNLFTQVRIFTDRINGKVSINGSNIAPKPYNRNLFVLSDSATRCQIDLEGKGRVYGISLETTTGVMVDNIPMRGCSGTIFTRMNATSLANYFQTTNTRLIIMQFGGNTIPHSTTTSSINKYVNNLRQQVRYMRTCAPYASILFIGPSDMSTRINGQMMTYPMVPYLDEQLKKMAEEEQISYWSMYTAMGGKNSMVDWVEKGLAGSDYVHFTRAGANKVGQMLYNWINSYQ
jgi:lysophospholipase L1-like esterase